METKTKWKLRLLEAESIYYRRQAEMVIEQTRESLLQVFTKWPRPIALVIGAAVTFQTSTKLSRIAYNMQLLKNEIKHYESMQEL